MASLPTAERLLAGAVRVLLDDGAADEAAVADVALAVSMYRWMLFNRVLDEKMMILQRQGRVGFWGAYTGQEAVPIGCAHALEPSDWVFPALREGTIMLVRGFPLRTYLAQVFGNSGDVAKGRQMPSHMAAREVNQVSWSSCVGPQFPHAVGAAWAAKLKGDRTVTLGFIGDGATSTADFHVALNFAGVFQVPCVLVVQNNQFAISVRPWQQTATEGYAVKARAYGLPGVRVDGNDALAVYRVIKEAADRARAGGGPTLVEAVTYRIGAHSSSDDPNRYRDPAEVEEWAKRDPLARLRRFLERQGAWDEARETVARAEHEEQIGRAIREVEAVGPPEADSLFDDVYATLPWHLQAQRDELRRQRS